MGRVWGRVFTYPDPWPGSGSFIKWIFLGVQTRPVGLHGPHGPRLGQSSVAQPKKEKKELKPKLGPQEHSSLKQTQQYPETKLNQI